jgi:tetratricopeptide (TPR) repeat protein
MAKSMKEWMEDPEFQTILGVFEEAHASEERLSQVGEILDRLRVLDPHDPILITAQGRLAGRWGVLADTRECYHHAQRLTDPKSYPSPWLNEAILYEDFGFLRKALSLYRAVLDSYLEEPRAQEAYARCTGKRRAMAEEHGLAKEHVTSGDPFVLNTLELLLAMGVKIAEVKGHVKDQHGLLREVDILAEIPSLDILGPLPLVIECKDWSRPVDRPVVDKYLSLLTFALQKKRLTV